MSKSDPYANQVKNWRSHGVKNSFSGADYYVISRGNGRREIFAWKEIVSFTSTCCSDKPKSYRRR
jgi:hypothetical protein